MKRINTSYKYALDKYNKIKKYELKSNIESNDNAVIVRLDGKGMTKSFKPEDKCFDLRFYNTMHRISEDIIKYFPYTIKTYSYKDEISIQIDYDKFKYDKEYDNRQEKLLSILSGYVSSLFNKYINDKNIYSFDARIIIIPKELVDDYFQARKDFATYAYLERMFDYYKIETDKNKFNLNYLLKQKDKIKKEDLYEYICFGITGRYIEGNWIVAPKTNKVIILHHKK